MPLTDLARLTQLPQLSVETRGYRFLEPLAEVDFNLDHPILKDVRVRAGYRSRDQSADRPEGGAIWLRGHYADADHRRLALP